MRILLAALLAPVLTAALLSCGGCAALDQLLGGPDIGESTPHPMSERVPLAAADLFERVNALRQDSGLKPLAMNASLERAAWDLADFMANSNHFAADADGAMPPARAERHGYKSCAISQNIAFRFRLLRLTGSELVGDAVQFWMQSPDQRQNILSPEAIDTGVAVAKSKRGRRVYMVQLFGRPAEEIEFQVSNEADADVDYLLSDQTFSLPSESAREHSVCGSPALSLPQSAQVPGAEIRPKDGDRFEIHRGEGDRIELRQL